MMENAIKYGDGRKISISFSEEEDCKLITVENTGCTLEEGEINNIFDSFYRGSNTTNIQGNGLGLYIVKQLIIILKYVVAILVDVVLIAKYVVKL